MIDADDARRIAYRAGYKYRLERTYLLLTAIKPPADIITDYIFLGIDGNLSIMAGYAWDGPSGPTIDTPDFMRGSLVHDALYQLMRLGRLDRDLWRDAADRLLRDLCLEDGMPHIVAVAVYQAVRMFAAVASYPESESPVLYAPPYARQGTDSNAASA